LPSFLVNGRDRNDVQQYTLDANVQGEWLELSAGTVTVAAGFETRHERGEDRPDVIISGAAEYLDGAPTTGQPREGTKADYRVTEAFTEFNVPLWADGEQLILQTNAALRFSHYDSFGSSPTGKIGFLYSPLPNLSFRTSWAQAFRAPSLLELYQGSRVTNLPAQDPCADDVTLPGCSGVPQGYQQSGSQVRSLVEGNADLDPETAQQWTLGATWSPVADWSLDLDLYRIHVEDIIVQFTSQQILDDCAFANRRCELVERDPLSGDIDLLRVHLGNAGSREVRGADLAIDGEWLRLRIRSRVSYLDQPFQGEKMISATCLADCFHNNT
jgi:outer membrane receptor protein involved in Fe transport